MPKIEYNHEMTRLQRRADELAEDFDNIRDDARHALEFADGCECSGCTSVGEALSWIGHARADLERGRSEVERGNAQAARNAFHVATLQAERARDRLGEPCEQYD